MSDIDSVFVIRNTETGKLFKSRSGKCGWTSSAAAKSAWLLDMRGYSQRQHTTFNEQEQYVVEEVK